MKNLRQIWEKMIEKNRLAYMLLASCLFTLIFGKFIVEPIQEENRLCQIEKMAYIDKYNNLQVYNISKAAYEDLIKAEREKLAMLETILPNELDQVQIITEINNSLKKENLQVESLNPVYQIEEKGEYITECKARGSYFSWLNWLKTTQTQGIMNIKVHSVNVDERGELLVAMQLVYYALK